MIAHELMPEATVGRPGQVILLNGTSSSGKSSIATELLDVLEDVWYHVPIDAFHRMRSRLDGPARTSSRRHRTPYAARVCAADS